MLHTSLEAYLSHLVPFSDKCHLTHKRLNMPQVKQYKLSVNRIILHFICQMTLESGTSPLLLQCNADSQNKRA
jgi:hypothetical protein